MENEAFREWAKGQGYAVKRAPKTGPRPYPSLDPGEWYVPLMARRGYLWDAEPDIGVRLISKGNHLAKRWDRESKDIPFLRVQTVAEDGLAGWIAPELWSNVAEAWTDPRRRRILSEKARRNAELQVRRMREGREVV